MAISLAIRKGVYKLYDCDLDKVITETAKLEDVLNSLDLKKPLSIYLDADEFFYRKATFPDIGIEKIREILETEMDGKFLLPTKELILDLVCTENTENGANYLVFALRKAYLMEILGTLMHKGANIVSISPMESEDLANFGVDATKLHSMNFLPKEFLNLGEKKVLLSNLKRAFYYLLTFLIILVLLLSIRWHLLSRKNESLKKEVTTIYNSLFTQQNASNLSLSIMQSKLKELKQNYRALSGVELLDILKDISDASQEKIVVKEINIDQNRLSIKGEGLAFSDLEKYKLALKKSFPAIQLIETKNLSDGKINFVMEAIIVER